MKIRQFDIYLADLDPAFGTEPGKVRPVVVIQSDVLNKLRHHSTLVCPLTSQVVAEAFPLRLFLGKKETRLNFDSDILVDQIRSIDNRRFVKHVGRLSSRSIEELIENLQIVLFE